MLVSCVLVVGTLCCHGMPTIARQGGHGVDSVRVGRWSNVMFSDASEFVLDFHDGQQKVGRRTGERYQPPAMIARDLLRRWKCHALEKEG